MNANIIQRVKVYFKNHTKEKKKTACHTCRRAQLLQGAKAREHRVFCGGEAEHVKKGGARIALRARGGHARTFRVELFHSSEPLI
jgi:hypothetical protein